MRKIEWKPQELKENIFLFKYKDQEIAYKYLKNKQAGNTILFFYGLCGSIMMTDYLTGFLIKKYSIIVIDYPGHTYSPKSNNYSIDNLTDLVLNLLGYLKIKEIFLLCYSLGGIIGLNFYQKYKNKIKKLIMLNSVPYFSNSIFKKIQFKIIELLLRINYIFFITKVFIPILKDKYLTKSIYKNSIEIVRLNDSNSVIKNYKATVYFDARNLLKAVKCPILLIGSKKDVLVKLKDLKINNINIKNSLLNILPDYGHLSIVTGPDVVSNKIINFLSI